jgi:hypothetical protein
MFQKPLPKWEGLFIESRKVDYRQEMSLRDIEFEDVV